MQLGGFMEGYHTIIKKFLEPITTECKCLYTEVYDGTTNYNTATHTLTDNLGNPSSAVLLGTENYQTKDKNVGTTNVTETGLYSGQLGYDIHVVDDNVEITP